MVAAWQSEKMLTYLSELKLLYGSSNASLFVATIAKNIERNVLESIGPNSIPLLNKVGNNLNTIKKGKNKIIS